MSVQSTGSFVGFWRQGFVYDGPAGRIGFRPRWQPENHVSFFAAAEGRRFTDAHLASAEVDGTTFQVTFKEDSGRYVLSLAKELNLKAGQTMKIQFSFDIK